uniref:Uncharacterized protein n=1 Tax=Anguilla anguilla TaxID=7936 RepID=A0A0E9RM49_ANGAN
MELAVCVYCQFSFPPLLENCKFNRISYNVYNLNNYLFTAGLLSSNELHFHYTAAENVPWY